MNNTQLQTAQQFLQKARLQGHPHHRLWVQRGGLQHHHAHVSLSHPERQRGHSHAADGAGRVQAGHAGGAGLWVCGRAVPHRPRQYAGLRQPEATAEVLQRHADGQVWLHLGDLGYITEDGLVYTLTRGHSPRFGGGELAPAAHGKSGGGRKREGDSGWSSL